MDRGKAFLLGVLTCFLLGPPSARALPAAEEAVELARKVSVDPAYQRDLPEEQGEVDALNHKKFNPAQFRLRRRTGVGPAGLSIVHLLFYLALGVALGLALVWLGAYWRGREKKEKEARGGEPADAGGTGPEPELEHILELARRRLFGEAMHQLLLLAVAQLIRRQQRDGGTGFMPDESLTGRELVRILPRDAQERQRFAHLVAAVEHSLFAGQAVDEAAFKACLESYRGLSG